MHIREEAAEGRRVREGSCGLNTREHVTCAAHSNVLHCCCWLVFWVFFLIVLFSCPQDGQSRTIRQFQFTDWPEQGVPKTGEGFIDFIGQVHKTKEQFGQDGPITVHCRYAETTRPKSPIPEPGRKRRTADQLFLEFHPAEFQIV